MSIPESIDQDLQSKPSDDAADAPWLELGLTRRQTDVLELLSEGKSNPAIAKKLGISVGVVKIHMTAIMKALRVQNRAEAGLLANRLKSINMRQVRQAEGGKLDLDWLTGDMTHQRVPKGKVLFRMGDSGGELYYLQRGKISLQEINSEMSDGTMFGEIGVFSPAHKRTCSAICASDVDLFMLTADQAKRLFLLRPQFALFIFHLMVARLMNDRSRSI